MNESATGIILRTRPLTETSLIVNWLTLEHGRLGTVAKGARRAKSPFTGNLDLFYEADFSFTRSRTSTLHALREVKLRESHGAIRQDITKLQQAAYATACLELATETETPMPEIYELTRGFLDSVGAHPTQPHTIFSFELKLLRELGLEPEVATSHLTPGAGKLAISLQASDWPGIARLKLSGSQNEELGRWLHGFLIFHLGKVPRGRATAIA
jgi:DNA repair protein RecO (recombination protein O)